MVQYLHFRILKFPLTGWWENLALASRHGNTIVHLIMKNDFSNVLMRKLREHHLCERDVMEK